MIYKDIMINNIKKYLNIMSAKKIFDLIDRICPNYKVRIEYRTALFNVLKNLGKSIDIF